MSKRPIGPVAQQLAKIQSNGQKASLNDQYPSKKDKIGFADKTAWDWLNLAGVLLIPLMIGIFTIMTTLIQTQISQQQHESDQTIATDQQRETLMNAYMDDITNLLLHEGLRGANAGTEVRVIAQTKTLLTLQRMDGERRGKVIVFLYDLKLIEKDHPIISLYFANLTSAEVIRHVESEKLDEGSANGITLDGADFSGADFSGADLALASLSEAKLEDTKLYRAELHFADLTDADLSGAELSRADLSRANLTDADLSAAALDGADLSNALVTPEQLAKAGTLAHAILPDGSTYPSQSYPIPHHKEPGA